MLFAVGHPCRDRQASHEDRCPEKTPAHQARAAYRATSYVPGAQAEIIPPRRVFFRRILRVPRWIRWTPCRIPSLSRRDGCRIRRGKHRIRRVERRIPWGEHRIQRAERRIQRAKRRIQSGTHRPRGILCSPRRDAHGIHGDLWIYRWIVRLPRELLCKSQQLLWIHVPSMLAALEQLRRRALYPPLPFVYVSCRPPR